MKSSKKMAAVLSLMLALVLMAAPVFSNDVKAAPAKVENEQNDAEYEFVNPKVTLTLVHPDGFFETLKKDTKEWYVEVKVRVGIKNGTDKKLLFEGLYGTDEVMTKVTVKPGKTKYMTLTFYAQTDEIMASALTEKQALELLNGKSIKVKTKPIRALTRVYESTRKGNDSQGFYSAGECELTFAGGEVDAAIFEE